MKSQLSLFIEFHPSSPYPWHKLRVKGYVEFLPPDRKASKLTSRVNSDQHLNDYGLFWIEIAEDAGIAGLCPRLQEHINPTYKKAPAA